MATSCCNHPPSILSSRCESFSHQRLSPMLLFSIWQAACSLLEHPLRRSETLLRLSVSAFSGQYFPATRLFSISKNGEAMLLSFTYFHVNAFPSTHILVAKSSASIWSNTSSGKHDRSIRLFCLSE